MGGTREVRPRRLNGRDTLVSVGWLVDLPPEDPRPRIWCTHQTALVAGSGTNSVQAGCSFVRWMCGTKLKDRSPSRELRERLRIDDIALVLQHNRLRWYGHVLRQEGNVWVRKCMEFQVEGPRPRGRPKRTWREVVREDCQAHKLNTEDAMDRSKWRNLIRDARWSGWARVGEFLLS